VHDQQIVMRARAWPAVPRHSRRLGRDRELISECARRGQDIGYDQNGFSYHGATSRCCCRQSPTSRWGVDAKKKKSGEEEGAATKGMMFGLPATETKYTKRELHAAPIFSRTGS